MWVCWDGIWFGFIRSALRRAIVLCWVDRCCAWFLGVDGLLLLSPRNTHSLLVVCMVDVLVVVMRLDSWAVFFDGARCFVGDLCRSSVVWVDSLIVGVLYFAVFFGGARPL